MSELPPRIVLRRLCPIEAAAAAGHADDTVLADLRREVVGAFAKGPRALILRGFEVEGSGEAALDRALQMVGSWLGQASPQSPEGELVARVEHRPHDPQARGTHSEDELQAHTDLHDILALACVRQAPEGGDSLLVSAAALRQHIARTAPEALAALERGYYFGTNPVLRSDHPVSRTPVPVFLDHEGAALVCWNGYFMRMAALHRGEEPPADLQAALGHLRKAAAELAAAATFRLMPGDMLFWHNWSWLHGRTAFRDDPARPRLLLRLWLRSELVARPAILAERAAAIDADHRLTQAMGYRTP